MSALVLIAAMVAATPFIALLARRRMIRERALARLAERLQRMAEDLRAGVLPIGAALLPALGRMARAINDFGRSMQTLTETMQRVGSETPHQPRNGEQG